MSDLLREIDDAVRAEKVMRIWDEYKNVIITGVAALVLGTAAFSYWHKHEINQNRHQTGDILRTLDQKDPASALVELAKTQKGNAPAVAYLNAAALELKAGNKQKALYAYIAAQNTKSDDILRDLATIQKVNLTLDVTPDAKAADLLKDLQPIAENKKSPWAAEAIFTGAFVKGEKNKDYAGAIADLKTLQSRDDVTDSFKQRATALQSIYDLKLQEKK